MVEDFERCYRAVQSRDARFDGWFFTGVTSTGIYCRPSCAARTPKPLHVRFYATAAAAQQAGFRACRRCRPDAVPGSPEWNLRADTVARAMRLIADGTVDRDGVGGLAGRLGYSQRQLHRLLVAEVGTGPLALARAQRAQSARVLLETTRLPAADVAFAAGFASVRQFNDTVRAVFAVTPTELRRRRPAEASSPRARPRAGAACEDHIGPGALALRLAYRRPLAAEALLGFLGARAVSGIESFDGGCFQRSLALAHGQAVAQLRPGPAYVHASLWLEDLRDLTTAVNRCRRLLDLDADPEAVDAALGEGHLAPLVRCHRGLRVPGAADGFELAARTVLGQQVSVAGARTVAGRLVAALGRPLPTPKGPVTHTFPDAVAVAEADLAALPMPRTRRRALQALATAVAEGTIALDAGAVAAQAVDRLRRLPGVGPWTSAYIAMRALKDPDVFLASDLGVLRALDRLGMAVDARAAAELAEAWRPWRSYATAHLWQDGASPRARAAGPSVDRKALTKEDAA